MARTTDTEVKALIDVEEGKSLTPFISAASNLVTTCCTGDAVEVEYETLVLTEIETWLAAHMYTVYDPRAETEKAGKVAAKYQSKVDLGLSTSHYGQMAMMLDTQGGLARYNQAMLTGGARTVGITALGQDVDELDANYEIVG
jgi:hypothetical protein